MAKFLGALAQSHLGVGVDMGLWNKYAASYSVYLTIPAEYAIAGQKIFQEANGIKGSPSAQIACLKDMDAVTLSGHQTVAKKVMIDGYYVDT